MRKTDWAADFSVFDERGQLAAIAEATAQKGVDHARAWEWFRFRLENERVAGPPFVLLVTPDRVFLWKRGADGSWPEPVVADAGPILAPYVSSRLNLASMYKEVFELIVSGWLGGIVNGLWQPKTPDQIKLIVESGLFEAIENGNVGERAFA